MSNRTYMRVYTYWYWEKLRGGQEDFSRVLLLHFVDLLVTFVFCLISGFLLVLFFVSYFLAWLVLLRFRTRYVGTSFAYLDYFLCISL